MQQTKSEMRKAVLQAGHRTRGLSDTELRTLFNSLESGQLPPVPEKKKPTKKPNKFKQPDGLGQPEAKPEAKPEAPASRSEVLKPLDTTGIASAIEAAIAGAMSAPEIDESKIIDLIKTHSQAPTRIEYEVNVTRGDKQVKIPKAHKILGKVLDVASLGENVFLAGPAACGKTTLGEQCADALGYSFHFTGSVADKYELTGFIDANGTFHESSFYKALTFAERGESGAVFMFDEIDASVPVALVAANAALENGYFNFPNKRVEFDKSKVFFLACANTLGKGANRQYTGRYPLDDATLNRFWRGHMEYDTSIELSMAESAWLEAGGSDDQKSIAIDFAHEVIAFRRQLEDKNIVCLISPRHTRRGAGLLAKGWKLKDVRLELYIDLSDDILKTLGVSRHG